MFKYLTDFAVQRTGGQAFGFWLTYFVLALLLGAVVGGIAGGVTGEGYDMGVRVGWTVAIIYVAGISLAVCVKRQFGFVGYLMVAVAELITVFGGALFGLIVPAVMTTRPSLRVS